MQQKKAPTTKTKPALMTIFSELQDFHIKF